MTKQFWFPLVLALLTGIAAIRYAMLGDNVALQLYDVVLILDSLPLLLGVRLSVRTKMAVGGWLVGSILAFVGWGAFALRM